LPWSGEEYAALIDSVDVPIIQLDSTGTILLANSSAQRLAGEPHALSRRSIRDVTAPEDTEVVLTAIRQLGSGEAGASTCSPEHDMQFHVSARPGETIRVAARLVPHRDPKGVLLGCTAVLGRLPDAGQPHDDFRSLSQKAVSLLENTTEPILGIDRGGVVTTFSDGAFTLLGREPRDTDRRSIADLGILRTDDWAVLSDTLQRSSEQGQKLVLAVELFSVEGASMPAFFVATPGKGTGSAEGAFRVLPGESDKLRVEESLRASEEHYRLLADNIADVIWTTDKDGWFSYLSPSVYRVLGYTVEEAMALKPFGYLSPRSLEVALASRRQREPLADRVGPPQESDTITMELEIRRRDGSMTWTESAINFLRDPEGRVVSMLGVTRDISERKKSEEKLEQLYRQERELRQQIEAEMNRRLDFTRALAHELKTPLTPVLASIDSLLAQLKEEPLLSLARNISRGASNLNSRIDELLDLAKGEVGILELRPEWVDLQPMLREVADTLVPVATNQGQTLAVELPQSLPPVYADVPRVQQVVLNMLENALKFTPKGGKIVLRAARRQDSLVVDIQDTGPGLSKEEQERVFDPYHRVAKGKGRLGGLGLGLALCKTLVELHGGNIWVRSRPGKGSTFSFSLPVEEERPIAEGGRGGDKLWKVLIIEDDPEIVDSVMLSFQIDWPEAQLVSTRMGEEGIDLVETEAPDIVILDLGLPDVDGFEVLNRIRLFSPVPVVVLTVREEESTVTRALELGADDYVTKPFRKRELLSRLKVQLRKQMPPPEEAPIICGSFRLDPVTYQLHHGSREISLTVVEGRIMQCLMQNVGHVTTYSRLTEAVWGEDNPGAIDSLRVYIGYIRRKLETDPSRPRLIRTKAGIGYSLVKST